MKNKQPEKWKMFPNSNVKGYYCFLKNYIQLNTIEDENEFNQLLKNPTIDKNKFSIYLHEQQHYIDQISTYWGIKNLYLQYKSYNVILEENEKKLINYRTLYLNIKRNFFLDFYTEYYSDIDGSYLNPWKFKFTIGYRYDFYGDINENFPIPLITFETIDNEKISRVPLSIVSLLETTATYRELQYLQQEALKLNEPFKTNALSKLSKDIEKIVYNSKLTLYSAAVHLVGITLQIQDSIFAFKISSIFSKISLNIPEKYFNQIIIPLKFQESVEWVDRCKKALLIHDRGILFYLLVNNYLDKYNYTINLSTIVEDILGASNLPNQDEIIKQIEIDKFSLYNELFKENNYFSNYFLNNLNISKKIYDDIGITQIDENDIYFKDINPYISFASTYIDEESINLKQVFDKIKNNIDLDFEEWFIFSDFSEKRFENFYSICGI